MTNCTSELSQLDDNDVMNSKVNDHFERRNILNTCMRLRDQLHMDPFAMFCLYPPSDEHMINMCNAINANSFFSQMLTSRISQLSQLPRVISYMDLKSDNDFVTTTVRPGTALARMPSSIVQLVSSNDANVNLAATSDARFPLLGHDLDGLMRNISTVSSSAFVIACVVNGAGTVRGYAHATTGAFVATQGSNGNYEQLMLPSNVATVNLKHGAMIVWDVGQNTFIALASESPVDQALFVHQYAMNDTQLNPSSVVPYKQTRIPFTSLGVNGLAWCQLSREENMLCIGHLTGELPGFLVYRVSTQNDGQQHIRIGAVRILTAIVLGRFFGALPPNLLGPATFVSADSPNTVLSMTLPAVDSVVSGTFSITPTVVQGRFVQRKNVIVDVLNNQLRVNSIPTPTPFLPSVSDAYAISPDGQFITVFPQSNGRYHRFSTLGSQWQVSDSLDLFFAHAAPRLDETQDGKREEWFLGTTIGDVLGIPPIMFPNKILLTSRHMLLQLVAERFNMQTRRLEAVIKEANVYRMITTSKNETRLYDSGQIRIFSFPNNTPLLLWQSFTDDKEGSDTEYNILSFVHITPQARFAVSSPNGRYMLLVLEESVDLVFNPFNAPRFTTYVVNNNQVSTAVTEQSTFCFKALNNNSLSPLAFVDGRCTCLPSDRLAARVYPAIQNLDKATQITLSERVPCVMKDCKVAVGEFSVANFGLQQRCADGLGICSQFADASIANLLVTQDCGTALRSCVDSSHCPVGSNCRNGQCVATCSSDITCQQANPNARCINGQCQLVAPKTTSSKLSITWILAIVVGCMLFVVLLLLIYFSVLRTK